MELIISHTNCDFDGFASMLAASLLYPSAKMCFVGSVEVNLKNYLHRYEKQFEFIKEKNVTAEEITKLVIVDNRDIKRMGKIGHYLEDESFRKKITIICYDHHPESETDIESDYSHLEMTGACTTIMLDFLNNAGIQINSSYATVFALGIYEDTGNFLNANTTQKDFAAVSYLFSLGAAIDVVRENLLRNFTPDQLDLIGRMSSVCETILIKGIETSFIEIELADYQDEIAFLLQTVKASRNIKLIFCTCYRQNKVSIIARNDYDFIHLDRLLNKFGGGGHKSAGYASFMFSDGNKPDVRARIVSFLEDQILEYGIAKDLMTSPVSTMSSGSSVDEARAFLIRNNFSTVVVSKDGQLCGIATKKDISRALHHGMGESHLDSVMSANVITVRENDAICHVYKTMVDNNIGRLPVITDSGTLSGIITRGDLLAYHYKFFTKEKPEQTHYTNVKGAMYKNLNEQTLDLLKKFGHVADKMGMEAYVVGGFVRDLIMQRFNYDIDIVVEGDGLLFAAEFTKKFAKRCRQFPQFGTSYVVLKDGRKVDVATARTEYYPNSGSLPEVTFSSIRNDLYRRDFTINSLAIQINSRSFGNLHDFFSGRRDIKLGIIRVMNNFSFIEDPLRILRAIRFEQRFDFEIEDKTLQLLMDSLKSGNLKNVSVERIRTELIVSSQKGSAESFFARLDELGIWNHINNNIVFTPHKRVICQRIRELEIWFRNSFPKEEFESWICYHLTLISDLSLRIKERYARKYKYSTKFIDALRKSHRFIESDVWSGMNSDFPTQNVSGARVLTEGELAVHLSNMDVESIVFLTSLTGEAKIKDRFIKYLTESRFIKTLLDGEDIKSLGVPEGKEVGLILRELLKKKIDQKIDSRESELELAKNIAEQIRKGEN